MKSLIKKIIPNFVFSIYHWALAFLGAVIYGFPSRKLIVIGVTGTKGKTTTCNLIAQILQGAGYKTGMATTVNFRIGDKEWINEYKQTMLGRFRLQKLLRQMVRDGCKYAVVETSSEGILQHRHRFINYSVAVFTNLSPEHIERHGSFERYRAAKMKLFQRVAQKPGGISICNLDDESAEYFLKCGPKNTIGFARGAKCEVGRRYQISDVKLSPDKTEFSINGEKFEMPLIGEFNVYNATAAICAAQSQGVPMGKIKEILKNAKPAPGRLEVMKCGQPFTVIVDYAHEPASLEAAYKAIKVFNPPKIIAVLGSQGGGRDKRKRPELGRIAGEYAGVVIITNEDPYDEDPQSIIDDVAAGITFCSSSFLKRRLGGVKSGFNLTHPNPLFKKEREPEIFKIIDRRQAINKALSLAQAGDVVIISGKGGEVWMCVEGNKKIPWNDREIIKEWFMLNAQATIS